MVRESRHLWVGNLPEKIQEDDLVKYFERFGRVQGVKLLKDHTVINNSAGNSSNASSEPGSNAAAAVAFIDIKSASKAHAAQHSLDGRILKTDYCDAHAHSTSAIHGDNNNNNNIANPGKQGAGAGPGGITPNAAAAGSASIDDDRSHTTNAKLSTKIRPRTDSVSDNEGIRGEPSEEEISSHRNNNISPGGSSSLSAQISSVPRVKSFKSSSSTSQTPASIGANSIHASGMNSSSQDRSSSSRKPGGKSRESGTEDRDRDRRRVRRNSVHDTVSLSERTNSLATAENESARNSRESSPGSQENAGSSASSCGRQFIFETLSQDKRPLAICVRNLPSRSSDSSLKDGLFHEYKKYGKIIAVKVQGNGADRYGIICFKRPEDVEKACDMSREKKFFGASVSVSACKEPVDLVDADYRLKDDELDEYHPKATRTLYVGDLEKNVDEEELKNKFDSFGEILDVDIKRQATGSSYAFIQFTDIASVVKALRKMEGCTLSGGRVKLGFGKSMPTTCIWCDNLPEKISERAVIAHFARAGPVRYCSTNRENGQALIFFETVDFAQTAITDLRCKPFQGRRIQLDYASRECQASFFQEMERSGQMTMERKANPFWETISHLGTPVRETFPPFTDARHLINRQKERQFRQSRDIPSRVRERPADREDSYERELWEYNSQRERRTDKRSTGGESPPARRENGHARTEHSDAESITSDQTEHSSNRRFFRNMTPSPPASPSSSRKQKRSSGKKSKRRKSKNYDRTRSVSPSSPISPSQAHSDDLEDESARSPVRRHSSSRRKHRSPSHDSFNSQSSPKLKPSRIRHDSGPRTPDSLEELVPESPVATPKRAADVEMSEAVSSNTRDVAKLVTSTVAADSNTPEVSSSNSSRWKSTANSMETGSDVVTSTVNHTISPTSCHDPVVPSSPDSESSKKSESPLPRRSLGFEPVPDFYQRRIERKGENALPFCDLLIPEFAFPSSRTPDASASMLDAPMESDDIPTPPSSPKPKLTLEDRFKALDEKFDKISSVSSAISQITRSISVSESPEKPEKIPLRKRSSDFGMGSLARSDSLENKINQRFKSPDSCRIPETDEPKTNASPETSAPNTPGPLSNIAKYTANPKFTIRSASSGSSPEKHEHRVSSPSSSKPVTSDISAKILSITAEASAKFSQHQQSKAAPVAPKVDLVPLTIKSEPDLPVSSKTEPVSPKKPEPSRTEPTVKTEPVSPRKPDSTVSASKPKPAEKVESKPVKTEKLVPLEKKKVEKPLPKPALDGKSKAASAGGVGFLFREDPNAKMFRGNAPVLSAQQLRQLEKEKAEKERLERKRLEEERIERERLEKERAEKERIEKERLEKERLEKERIERERAEKERAEKARLLAEKQERERQERERERAEKEKARLARKAAEEKAAKEKAERERVEKERLEKERKEKEERERIEKERLEKEKEKERERKRQEEEKQRLEAEKEAAARAAKKVAKAEKAAPSKSEKVVTKVEDQPLDFTVKKKKDQPLVAEVKPLIPPPKKSLFSSSDEKLFSRKAEEKKTKKAEIIKEAEPEPEKRRGLALMAKKPPVDIRDEAKKAKPVVKPLEPVPPKKWREETPEKAKPKPIEKPKEEPKKVAKVSKFKRRISDSESPSPSPPPAAPPKAVGTKKWETDSDEPSEEELKQPTPPPPPAPKKRGRKPKQVVVEPSSDSDSDSDRPKKNIFEVVLNPQDLQCSMYDKIKRRACTKPAQPPAARAPSVPSSTARQSVASTRDSVKKDMPSSVKPSRTSSINSSSSDGEKIAKPSSPSSPSAADSDYSQKVKAIPKRRSPVPAKKGRPPGRPRQKNSSSESDSSSTTESDFTDFSDGSKKKKQKKTKKKEKVVKRMGHKSRGKKRDTSSSSSSGSESSPPRKRAVTPPKTKPAKKTESPPAAVETASKTPKRPPPGPAHVKASKTKAPSRSPSPANSRLSSPDTKSSSSRPSPPKRKASPPKEKPLPPAKPKEKEKPKSTEKEKPKPVEKPKERIKSPEKEKPSEKIKPRSEDRDDAGGFDGGTYNLSKLMKNTFMDSASRESSVASPAAALTPKPIPPSPKKHKARSNDRSPAAVEVKSPLSQHDQKKMEGMKWGASPRGEMPSPAKIDPKPSPPKVLSPVRSPAKEDRHEKAKPVEKVAEREKPKQTEKTPEKMPEIQRPKAPVYVPPPEEPAEPTDTAAEHNIEEEMEAAQMLQDMMDNEPNRNEPVIHIPDGENEAFDGENELAIASIEAAPGIPSVGKPVESPERKRELPPSMYEPMPQPEFRPMQQVPQQEPGHKMGRNENERVRAAGNDGCVNRHGEVGANRPEPSPVIQQKSPLVQQQQPQKSPLVPHQQQQQPPQQMFVSAQRTASDAMLSENEAKRMKKQRDEDQVQQHHLMHQGMPPALFMGMNPEAMHKLQQQQQPVFQQGKMDEQQLMQLHRQQQEFNQALLFQSQVGYPPGTMAQSPSFRSAANAFVTSMPGPLRENQPSQLHHQTHPSQPPPVQAHPVPVSNDQKEKDRKSKKRKTSSVEETPHVQQQQQPQQQQQQQAPVPNPPMVSMDHPAARMMMQQMAQQGAQFQAQGGQGPLLMRFPGQGLVSFQPFQQMPGQPQQQPQQQQSGQAKQPVFGPPPNAMRPPSNIPQQQQHGSAPQQAGQGMDGNRSGSSAHRSHGPGGNKPENSVPSPVVNQNQQKQAPHQQMPSPSVPQSPQGMQQPSPQMQQHPDRGHPQPPHNQQAHQKPTQQQQQMQQHLQQQQQLLQQKMQQQQQQHQQQATSGNQQGQASVIMSNAGGAGSRQLPGVHLQGAAGNLVINASTGAPMFIPVSQPQQVIQQQQGSQGQSHGQQHHSSQKEASQSSRSSTGQSGQPSNQPPPTSHASHRPTTQLPFPHQAHPSNQNLPIDPAHLAIFQNLNPADPRAMGGAISKLLQHSHQQNVAEHQKESQQHPHVNRPEPQREKTPIRPNSTVAFSTPQGMMDASAFLPPQFVYGAYPFGAPPGAEGIAAFRPPFMPQELQQAMQQAVAVQAGIRNEQEKMEQEQRFRGAEGHPPLGHWGAMPSGGEVARMHAAPVATNLPVVWQGTLALKNDHAFVRMHLVSGNQDLVRMSLPMIADTSQNILKISQRMRLEAAQLESVSRRMQESQEHCILVACASGKNETDRRQQADMLITGFITYLQQKQAAGIVNINPPGQNAQPQYVIHIFPPCDFSKRSLAQFGPGITQTMEATPHLFVVITPP